MKLGSECKLTFLNQVLPLPRSFLRFLTLCNPVSYQIRPSPHLSRASPIEHYMNSIVDGSKITIYSGPNKDTDNQKASALYNRQSLKKS